MRPGERLSTFRVLAPLGRGGMGAVFRAVDEATGREVALKVLADGWQDPALCRRFEREGRALAAVTHPNVVRAFAAGVDEGRPYLALELATGGSLDGLARERGGRLPWREATRLAADVARGLAALHAAGLVHRDLKPANVVVDDEGRAKVTDLGLVRADAATGLTRGGLTRSGESLGTAAFMAPEQIDATRDVDERADLYALGATIFAVVTGRPPFQGHGLGLLKQVLEAPAAPLASLVPEAHPDLDALVLRLLDKAPAARPSSAAEVARALERIAAAPDVRPRRPRRLALGAAALGALGLAGLGARGAGRGATPPRQDAPAPVASAAPGLPTPTSAPDPALTALATLGPHERLAAARQWLDARSDDDPSRREAEALVRRTQEVLTPRLLEKGSGKAAAAFLTDGRLVTAIGHTLSLWARLDDRAPRSLPPLGDGPPLLAATPDGGFVVANGPVVRRFSPDAVELEQRSVGSFTTALAVAAAGQVAAGNEGGAVVDVFERSGEQRPVRGHSLPVYAIAIASDGEQAVTGTGAGFSSEADPGVNAARLWDLTGARPTITVGMPMRVTALTVLPGDEEILVGLADGTLLRLDWSGATLGELVRADLPDDGAPLRPTAHQGCLSGLVVSRDGRRLWSVTLARESEPRERNELRAWDLETGRERYRVLRHRAPLRSLSLSPDEQWLVTGSEDGRIELWRAE